MTDAGSLGLLDPARFAGTPLQGIDTVLADLDGVVYAGAGAIPHAVEALSALSAAGMPVGYITNNASRSVETVAEHLRGFGLPVEPNDVVSSPQAAVALLADLVPAGSTILVVGGEGILVELERAGYGVTRSALDRPAAVVQGFHPSVGWEHLAEATYAIRDGGIPWIATNQDWTIPQARGIAPGNGTLVSAVHTAVGILPTVAGKPEVPIFHTALERFGCRAPLMIGDRLDTDILGANRAGFASLMVLTGIDGPKQLLAANPDERPAYVVDDLRGLTEVYPLPEVIGGEVHVGDSVLGLDGLTLEVRQAGSHHTNLVRAACAVIWGSGRQIYAFEVPELIYDPSRMAG